MRGSSMQMEHGSLRRSRFCCLFPRGGDDGTRNHPSLLSGQPSVLVFPLKQACLLNLSMHSMLQIGLYVPVVVGVWIRMVPLQD